MLRQYIANIIFCVYIISRVTSYLHECYPHASNEYPHKIRLDEPFEFRCDVYDDHHSTVGSKNCILTHRDGDTNETITCISNENATPCLGDHRIIIESIVEKQSEVEQHITTTTDMLVSCSVSIQNAKSGDVGTWTLTQNQVGGPSVRASKN